VIAVLSTPVCRMLQNGDRVRSELMFGPTHRLLSQNFVRDGREKQRSPNLRGTALNLS
jgi:hypothetical protein